MGPLAWRLVGGFEVVGGALNQRWKALGLGLRRIHVDVGCLMLVLAAARSALMPCSQPTPFTIIWDA